MTMASLKGLRTVNVLFEELAEIIATKATRGPTTFGDCLDEWVQSRAVIEAVGGDQATYLTVVVLALAKFHDDPAFFGADAAEGVTGIFRLGRDGILPTAL